MIEIVLAFLAGLLIGSFLNVCIFRLPWDLSVVQPRSFCPGCMASAEKKGMSLEAAMVAARLPSYDLIPLVSYLALRGKCRRCGLAIPWRYPLVELLTGIAFAACVAAFGLELIALKYAIYSAIMITLIFTDLESWILPDEFTLGGMVVGLVFAALVPMQAGLASMFLASSSGPDSIWLSVAESMVGAGFCSGLTWLFGWAFEKIRGREGMGLGDVKMLAMIGSFLGLSLSLLTLIIASCLGTIWGLPVGMIRSIRQIFRFRERLDRGRSSSAVLVTAAESPVRLFGVLTGRYVARHHLPFGVFLGIAALIAAVYGEVVMKSYSAAGQ